MVVKMVVKVAILYFLLFSQVFAGDPAKGDIKSADTIITNLQFYKEIEGNHFMIPPELNLTLTPSTNQDTVYVSFTSNQPLYAGWTDTTFCSTYINWNYWWLNTRLGIDDLDTIYVLVSLLNYSNLSNYNFHRDILNYAGNVIRQDAEWNGYQMQPIVKDGLGNNHYIGHPIIGWNDNMDAGAVDTLNFIYSSKSSGNIYFTKLDSIGNFIFNQIPVAMGDTAQAWNGDSHIDIDSEGNIYIAWSRDMHEIVYSKSKDGGATWGVPITIASDFGNQVNKPEILVSPDDHIHFIWQHWTGSHNCLIYKKLNQDGSCCIDTTNLTPGMTPEVWHPQFVVDADTNIHIVWSPSYSGSNSLYYTLINGKLDKGGLPATDDEISIIQEYPFYSNTEQKRYPKIITDSLCCPNVIFDQGEYGNNNTKTVYHIKKTLTPQGIVISPDSSIHKIDIDTVGGYTSLLPISVPGRYFVKVWGWNSSGEMGWDTASITITGISENDKYQKLFHGLIVSPTVFTKTVKIKYQIPDYDQNYSLIIYNINGQAIKHFTRLLNHQLPFNEIIWDGKDDFGKRVLPGSYFVQFKTINETIIKKVILLK